MLQQLERVSAALQEASRTGRLDGCLAPAMAGCPECRTAWVIASPIRLGSCAGCGMVITVLSDAQVAMLLPAAGRARDRDAAAF